MPDKSDKYPWMQFYIADWLRDTALCSPATRGIWLDALCVMWGNGRTGELRGTYDQLARALRCTRPEVELAVAELEQCNTADVKRDNDYSGNVLVTLINRRMQREYKERMGIKLRVNRHRGNGHGNAPVTPSVTGDSGNGNGEVTTHKSESESESKGELARAGAHAHVMSPDRENQNSESNPPLAASQGTPELTASERITREWELERVEAELQTLQNRKEGGYRLTDAEKLHRAGLKERRIEILTLLGMKA
ncbi:MAG TPA: hypothetical protein VFB72_18700 [Verrucomicrobiae bacterium]|nr:hypothetical protein [Verrucomicrobiae bacterium]